MADELEATAGPDHDDADRRLEFRIYRHRVMVGVIALCSVVFLGGLWALRIDLSKVFPDSRVFSEGDICLKNETIETPTGDDERFKVCTEWIDLGDTSGNTHKMAVEDLEIRRKKDGGGFEATLKHKVNYPLIVLIGFTVAVMFGGRRLQSVLIERYKRKHGIG
jgi:hypothetical protein